jgi:hypothetical protein
VNNLDRNIKAGEEVIVLKEDFADPEAQEKDRIFICDSGYGMSSFTSGGKIFGVWKKDGSKGMIRGINIDAEATAKHQAKTRFGTGNSKGGRGG